MVLRHQWQQRTALQLLIEDQQAMKRQHQGEKKWLVEFVRQENRQIFQQMEILLQLVEDIHLEHEGKLVYLHNRAPLRHIGQQPPNM